MKQIFPDIRPRRLGTRGNSRYCYAALRKTTKLSPPQLPDIIQLGQFNSQYIPHTSDDDSSSLVIKKWAEGFFNIKLDNLKELADYITANSNNLKPLDGGLVKTNASKDYRTTKRINDTNLMKKRRKKKQRKQLFNADSEKMFVSESPLSLAIKDKNTSILPNLDNISNAATTSSRLLNCGAPPINNTSITAPSNIEQLSQGYPNKLMENFEHGQTEIDKHSSVVCKKVKQALQNKILPDITVPLNNSIIKVEPIGHCVSHDVDFNIMGPPVDSKTDLIRSQQFDTDSSNQPSKRFCARFNHRGGGGGVGSDSLTVADDIVTDISIPRERVISICNLDKDALDDYLVDENNSQEQEAELLKYFNNDADNSNSNSDSNNDQFAVKNENDPNDNSTVTCLPNTTFPLSNSRPLAPSKGFDEISELRQCLQQSLPSSVNALNDLKTLPQTTKVDTVTYPTYIEINRKKLASAAQLSGPNTRDVKRKVTNTDNSTKSIPPSPNTRRKNFTFVPISPGPQSPRRTSHCQNDASPKKVSTRPNHYSPVIDHNTVASRYSANYAELMYARAKEDISFSAPSSPLLPLRSMNLANNNKYNNIPTNYMLHQQDCLESRSQSVPLHRQSPAVRNISKFDMCSSVSHSVQPTPIPSEFTDFSEDNFLSSILGSGSINVPPPPPPSTSSTPSLSSTTGTSIQLPTIKIENNSIVPHINTYAPEITSSGQYQHGTVPPTSSLSNYYSASRSFPSTPQPLLLVNARRINAYDISKSVPTTPINVHSHPTFRYSPEQNRDFLINGNSVDPCLAAAPLYNSPSNPNRIDVDTNKPYPNEIDELSTFDDVADPIVASDILNNL